MPTAVTRIPDDLRAVLFDVDGTLVDSTAAHALCWHEALRAYGHTVPTAKTNRAIGMGSQQLIDSVLADAEDRSHDDEIIEAHRVLYRLFWERLAPLPGAVDLLRACHDNGRRVVLASSAAADELAMLRRVLDADHLIDAATDSSDVEATKPASDLEEVALSRAGVRAEQALFVGDAVWDGLAASGAGVAFVGVACGAANAAELRKPERLRWSPPRASWCRSCRPTQRHYFSGSDQTRAKAGTIAVTILAESLNYAGVNPKITCHIRQPSK